MSAQPASRAELDELLSQLRHELDSSAVPPAVVLHEFVTRHRLRRDQLDDLAAILTALPPGGPHHKKHTEIEIPPRAAPGFAYVPRHAKELDQTQFDTASTGELTDASSDDDFVEYDEFGLPVSAPPAIVRPATTDVTERCVNDLMDDWQRQGALSLTDIHRSAAKLTLGASQIAQVIARLESVGAYDPESETVGRSQLNDLDDTSYVGGDSVRSYLREIGRYRLLRAEEEVELGRRIHAGQSAAEQLGSLPEPPNHGHLRRLAADGRAAHSQMVCANLRLAVNMARHPRFRSSSVEFLDRIQFGNLGLIRAADKYDYSLGFKFSTYATWWVRQSVERGIADEGRLIRLPVHMVEKLNRLKRVRARLSEAVNHAVTVRELADYLGEDPGSVAAMLDYERMVHSLDAGMGEDGDTFTLLDVVEDSFLDVDPADDVTARMTTDQMHSLLLKILTAREYKILNERLGLVDGDKRTLDDIGEDLGVTRERVRQIQNKALSRLRGSEGEAIRKLISSDGQTSVRALATANAATSGDELETWPPVDVPVAGADADHVIAEAAS